MPSRASRRSARKARGSQGRVASSMLVPCRSAVASRRDVDTCTRLTRELRLTIPIVAANMDTVTEARTNTEPAPRDSAGYRGILQPE